MSRPDKLRDWIRVNPWREGIAYSLGALFAVLLMRFLVDREDFMRAPLGEIECAAVAALLFAWIAVAIKTRHRRGQPVPALHELPNYGAWASAARTMTVMVVLASAAILVLFRIENWGGEPDLAAQLRMQLVGAAFLLPLAAVYVACGWWVTGGGSAFPFGWMLLVLVALGLYFWNSNYAWQNPVTAVDPWYPQRRSLLLSLPFFPLAFVLVPWLIWLVRIRPAPAAAWPGAGDGQGRPAAGLRAGATVRFKLSYRLASLIPPLIVIAWWLWWAIVWSPRFDLVTARLAGAGMAFVLGLGLLLFALLALPAWTWRLQFGHQYLQSRALGPWPRRLCCTYSDVLRVGRRVRRGTLEIVPRGGKPLLLVVSVLEGGADRTLKLLHARVAAERFETDLAAALWRWAPLDRFAVFTSAALVLIPLQLLAGDLLPPRLAWRSAGRSRPGSSVYAFVLDSLGTPWLVTQDWASGRYRVDGIAGGRSRSWEVPDMEASWTLREFPITVADGESDQFWFAGPDRLFHWSPAGWQAEPMTPETSAWLAAGHEAVNVGVRLWAASPAIAGDSVPPGLVSLDLSAGLLERLPLPEPALEAGYNVLRRLHTVPGRGVLVLAFSGEQGTLYLLRDGSWQEPGYPVPLPQSAQAVDFAVDAAGAVWLLVENPGGGFSVGRLDDQASSWTWYPLLADCETCVDEYRSTEVDAHRRVWLAGYSSRGELATGPMLDVFEMHLDGSATRLVRYTRRNSNYQPGYSGNSLRLGPDGRMWTADRKLVWIDSTAPALPRPLPDWLVLALRPETGLALLGLVLLVPAALLAVDAFQRRRRPPPDSAA